MIRSSTARGCFKALMNALARPGKIVSIAENVKKIDQPNAPLVAAGLTLLDNWKKFFVYEAPELEEHCTK